MESNFIKSAIAMACFYVLYLVLARGRSGFTFNRYLILFAVIVSTIVPLINIQLEEQLQVNSALAQFVVIDAEAPLVEQVPKKSIDILSIVYMSGLLFVAVRFIIGLATLILMHRRSPIKYFEGFRIVITNGNKSPFTFFNLLFINKQDFDRRRLHELIIHEKVHQQQWHSVDLILMEILSAIHWFNPLIWLFKHDLKSEHEFLADEQVVEKGIEIGRYQELLLKSTEGLSMYLANHFNSSNLKKRLKMMNRKKSNKAKINYVMAVPAMLLLTVTLFINFSIKDQTATTPDVMPVYKEGKEAMYKKIAKTLKYPKEARQNNNQGTVYISFTVALNGEVIDIEADDNNFSNLLEEIVVVGYGSDKTPSKINRDLSALQEESKRVVGLLGAFKPGEKDGKPMSSRLTIPITFKIGYNWKSLPLPDSIKID